MRPLLLPLLSLVGLALAADAPPADDAATTEADSWDVNAAHGPTHDVALDLREGTWMSVAVRGDRPVDGRLHIGAKRQKGDPRDRPAIGFLNTRANVFVGEVGWLEHRRPRLLAS